MHQELECICRLSSAHQPLLQWSVQFVWPQPVWVGWLVFTDPSVAWISLSSWGSITHSNGRRQTSGHCSYSLAWSYHKREGQRASKQEGMEGGGALELKLTDRTTDPVILESHEWMLFFPLCWYGLLLSLAMSSQNTEYHSATGRIYRNCTWMEFDKWVET